MTEYLRQPRIYLIAYPIEVAVKSDENPSSMPDFSKTEFPTYH